MTLREHFFKISYISEESIKDARSDSISISKNHRKKQNCDLMSKIYTTFLLPARLLCPWDSSGKNTGVDCHAPFQGIFLTQGLNPHLLVSCTGKKGSFSLVPPGKFFFYLLGKSNLSFLSNTFDLWTFLFFIKDSYQYEISKTR